MFGRSVAGISLITFHTHRMTHSDIGNRVNDQPVMSTLLHSLGNEGDRWQETTGENPFLNKVNFTLIYSSDTPDIKAEIAYIARIEIQAW